MSEYEKRREQQKRIGMEVRKKDYGNRIVIIEEPAPTGMLLSVLSVLRPLFQVPTDDLLAV